MTRAPEFQNNVIVDMKTALDGGKKVKTQLFRSRGHRKIQKESYLTSKNCRVKMTPLRHSRVKMRFLRFALGTFFSSSISAMKLIFGL